MNIDHVGREEERFTRFVADGMHTWSKEDAVEAVLEPNESEMLAIRSTRTKNYRLTGRSGHGGVTPSRLEEVSS